MKKKLSGKYGLISKELAALSEISEEMFVCIVKLWFHIPDKNWDGVEAEVKAIDKLHSQLSLVIDNMWGGK